MYDSAQGHRRKRRPALVFTLLALPVAMLLAACGSSGGDSGGKGEPIKIMTIAPVETTGVSFPIFKDVAEVYEKWVNDEGGIKDRKVEVIFCDDQGVPTKAADCARKAVQEKVAAVVGGFTFQGGSIVPILKAANISYFGTIFAISPAENTSDNVQVLGSGFSQYTANGVSPGVDGCKKAALLTYDDANQDDVTSQVNNGLKSVGAPELFKTVLIPASVQDLAPQVEQATDGSDCVIAVFGQVTFPPFFTAFKAAGGTQRLYAQAGNIFPDMLTDFKKETENMVISGTYGNITSEFWGDYREALEKYNAPGDVASYNGSAGLGAWAGYLAFQQVAESLEGDITGANFLEAAKKATVDLEGKMDPVDFTNKFKENKNFVNQVNTKVSFEIVKNGEVLPHLDSKFFDMKEALLGNKLSAENTPPAVDPPVN